MDRKAAIDLIARHVGEIRALGVEHLYLFGSTARGEAGPASDVDIFIDYDDPQFSLVELARLKRFLSELLGAEADVTTRASLHPALKHAILRDAERVI